MRVGPTQDSLVGELAPLFELPSIQDEVVSLAAFQGERNVILWFSRGFTCNFCRNYMQAIFEGYHLLQRQATEVIQVAPNLLTTAQSYFGKDLPPYPFVCDPDKRLYAVYGLGDRGALEATRNTLVSFSTAFATGEGLETVRASFLDVANRNFLRRLHHHALTALDQGVFLIDKERIIRYMRALSAIEAIPTTEELLSLTHSLCP